LYVVATGAVETDSPDRMAYNIRGKAGIWWPREVRMFRIIDPRIALMMKKSRHA